jgi:hypothetical protein
MKKLAVMLVVIFQIVVFSCFSACGQSGMSSTGESPEPMGKLQTVDTYNADALEKYLNPIWQTAEMYDEGGVVVGETGEIRLLRKPIKDTVTVRSVHFDKTYREGIDYIVDGNVIRRIATGTMPYFKYEEYYFDMPYDGSPLLCDPGKAEIDYEGEKYLYYSEGAAGVKNHVMITYRTVDPYTQFIPQGDSSAQDFISKIKTDRQATIMFYGDSITEGSCASSTAFGGAINPYLPKWSELVSQWFADYYQADVTHINKAQGGWTTKQGLDNFIGGENRVGPYLDKIDLLVIAFGANDPVLSDEGYKSQIKGMVDMYLQRQPNGSILLVSPFVFNQQTSNWFINQYRFEGLLEEIKAEYAANGTSNKISVAKVYSFFKGICETGKLSRDYLGNNINHPNDFGVRIYAQVALKTLCGDEFFPVS